MAEIAEPRFELEPIDRKMRWVLLLVLIVAGGAAAVLLLTFEERSIAFRTAVSAPATIALWWAVTNMHFWEPEGDSTKRDILFRRTRGNVAPSVVSNERWAEVSVNPTRYRIDSPTTIALDRANSWKSLAGSLVLAAIWTLWAIWAQDASQLQDGFGAWASIGIAPALAYAVRSVFRLLLASRAVEATADGITLGPALGYVPALTIPANEIIAIETTPEHIQVLTTSQRVHELTRGHLVEPERLLAAQSS